MNKIIMIAVAIAVLAITAFYYSSIPIKNTANHNAIEADFSFNYQVLEARGKNITIFSKPDSYLIEFNRPRIPLYSKDIGLPENTSLKNISLKSSEMMTYENVEADFTPSDEHFVSVNDSLKGFYPEQVFWYNVFEALDRRKTIELIAAPMQYNNQTKQARIYNNMKVLIEYK